jgi:hypothetical protein
VGREEKGKRKRKQKKKRGKMRRITYKRNDPYTHFSQ